MKTINHKRRNTLKGMGLLALSPLYTSSLFADTKSKTLVLLSKQKEINGIVLPPNDYVLKIDMIDDYGFSLKNLYTHLSSKKIDNVFGVLSWADYMLLSQALDNKDIKLQLKLSDNINFKGQVFKLASFTCKIKKEKHYV